MLYLLILKYVLCTDIIFIILKDEYVSHTCTSYFKKHYLHLRARGGEVEDSKSTDSASEPCNKNINVIKINQLFFFFYKVLENVYIPYRLLLHYHTETKKL